MTTEEILVDYERVRRTGWAPEPMLTDEMRDEIIRLAGLLKSEQELGEALNNESNQRGARIEKLERSVRLLSGLDEGEGGAMGETTTKRVQWSSLLWGVIEHDGALLDSGGVPMLFRTEVVARGAERATRRTAEPERQVGQVRFVIELIR